MTLHVGDVFHAFIRVTHPPKDKLFIVVCGEDPVRFVLINTRSAAVVLGNPSLGPTQVPVSPADLPCLTHESFISCNELFGGFTSEELVDMAANGDRKGSLSAAMLHQVSAAIAASATVVERQKIRCVKAIDSKLNPPSA